MLTLVLEFATVRHQRFLNKVVDFFLRWHTTAVLYVFANFPLHTPQQKLQLPQLKITVLDSLHESLSLFNIHYLVKQQLNHVFWERFDNSIDLMDLFFHVFPFLVRRADNFLDLVGGLGVQVMKVDESLLM
jgi:hypothetical protein